MAILSLIMRLCTAWPSITYWTKLATVITLLTINIACSIQASLPLGLHGDDAIGHFQH